MSTSTAYQLMDNIRSAIAASYPSKAELTNRVNLEDNADHILKDGYDVAVGPATNDDQVRGRGVAYTRDISLILTKQVVVSDLQNDHKHEVEEALLEEMIDIVKLVRTSASVVQNVQYFGFTGDSGIEVINAESIKFLSTTIDFQVIYVEID